MPRSIHRDFRGCEVLGTLPRFVCIHKERIYAWVVQFCRSPEYNISTRFCRVEACRKKDVFLSFAFRDCFLGTTMLPPCGCFRITAPQNASTYTRNLFQTNGCSGTESNSSRNIHSTKGRIQRGSVWLHVNPATIPARQPHLERVGIGPYPAAWNSPANRPDYCDVRRQSSFPRLQVHPPDMSSGLPPEAHPRPASLAIAIHRPAAR